MVSMSGVYDTPLTYVYDPVNYNFIHLYHNCRAAAPVLLREREQDDAVPTMCTVHLSSALSHDEVPWDPKRRRLGLFSTSWYTVHLRYNALASWILYYSVQGNPFC